MQHRVNEYVFYDVVFPSDLRAEQVTNWLKYVSTTFAHSSLIPDIEETVVFEWRADVHGIKHRVGIPWQHKQLIAQLRSHIQGVHVTESELGPRPQWNHAVEIGMSDRSRPLDTAGIEAQSLAILTAATHDLHGDDALAGQIVVNPLGMRRQLSSTRNVASSRSSILKAVTGGTTASKDEIAQRNQKLSEPQFKMVLRIVSAASTPVRAQKLAYNVRDAYRGVNSNSTSLKATRASQSDVIKRFNKAQGHVFYPGQVSSTELATLSGWPIGGPMIGGLQLGKTQYLPPNEAIKTNGIVIGKSPYEQFNNRPIAIDLNDCRHAYYIGPSGLGKTTLMTNNLQRRIELGQGAIVIESKGDLFYEALDSVPRERLDDVIVADVTDHDWPVGLNILQEGDSAVIVDDLIRLFTNGVGDAIYLREIMYHGLHTLRTDPKLTVIDLLPFVDPRTPVERSWREHLIDQLPKGGEFYSYWKGFDQLKPAEQQQKIRPVANRMWQLTNRRDIRNMLGQSQSTISLRDVMRDNKLMFIYIPDSLGDETVSLLSSILVSALWDASRAVEKTVPTSFYFDEVQKFLNLPTDIAEMLSLARKYKINLNMAHQYVDQLPPKLFSAITNAGTKVAFNLDGPDAGRIQHLFGRKVTAADFMNLDPYQAIARVSTEGGSSEPTVIQTLERYEPHGLASEVRRRSRQQFSRSAESVDQEIIKRRTAPSKPVKARARFGDMPVEGRE